MEEIVTSIGNFKLRTPNAGLRNKALLKAMHGSDMNQYEFLIELLPMCIIEHPFGINSSVKASLEAMTIEDYDMLIKAVSKTVKPKEIDEEAKKSETS